MKVTMTSRGYQSLRFVDQAGNRGIAEQLYAPLDLSKNTPDDHAATDGAHPPG
jgi:hypothetical protein